MKMKIFSLFAGIGAFEKALDKLEMPYELAGFSEIDGHAVESYCAIHNVEKSKNYGDITQIDEKVLPKDIDLITYGFPCQDISIAGKQKGLFNNDGSQTRSGLFFEALRIIEATKPKVAIAENVKNLTCKKFAEQFKIVLESLEDAGYNNYWQVLNAKDFGIPQNRERVFIVSIRKDIDTGNFKFPEGFPLQLRLKDILEAEVDEKFYLSNKAIENMSLNMDDAGKRFVDIVGHSGSGGQKGAIYSTENGIGALLSTDYKQPKQIIVAEPQINTVGMLDMKGNEQVRRVYGTDGLSPTLNTMQGGHRQPKVLIREATKKGYSEATEGDSINLEHPNSKTRRGRIGHGVAQTITTSPMQAVIEPTVKENHGTVTATIQKIDIPQMVKVRKYIVDTDSLCECLRDHKSASNFSNKEIAEQLNVPQTKVEHWFRQDDCFAIPDADIWFDLKAILGITTDEFDESIMTFEEKEGVFEKSERHYLSNGIAPTLTSASGNEKFIVGSKVCEGFRIRKLTPKECWRLMGFDDADFEKAEKVNSNTQLYKQAGNSIAVPVLVHIFRSLIDCGIFYGAVTEQLIITEKEEIFPQKQAVIFKAFIDVKKAFDIARFLELEGIEYEVIQ